MIHSMTGYGAGHARQRSVTVDVELRSVNGRYLDLRFNFPRECIALEADARELIQARISRGTVTVVLFVRPVQGAARILVDEAHARAVIARLKRVATQAGLKPEGTLDTLLSVPGMVRIDEDAYDAGHVRAPFLAALDQALGQIEKARAREGAAMVRDMRTRITRIRSAATGIERRAPSVAAQYSERLAKRFDEMKKRLGVDVDPVRIMTEAGLFSERVDITEEITRMRSHLDQITDVLGGSGSSGKRLDFILQELFREITTIGNKANSVDISRHAIAIKEELEKLREQAQNIE